MLQKVCLLFIQHHATSEMACENALEHFLQKKKVTDRNQYSITTAICNTAVKLQLKSRIL